MVASDNNGCLDRAFFHQVIDGQPKLGALAISEPADACRQALKLDALARQFNPASQAAILREKFEHQIVGDSDIRSLARKRNPPKRPASLAKKRTNIFRNESRKVVSILHATLKRERSNVVSVVKGDRSHLLQPQHAFHVLRHRVERALLISLRIFFS